MSQCLFCEKPADSKEHLWSKWILNSLKSQDPIVVELGKAPPSKPFTGDVTVKCVCTECNNSWMSQLEAKIKPLVGSLMQDLSAPLDAAQQKDVALWALKTAMVLEGTKSKAIVRAYQQADCEQLRVSSSIPPRTRIWLGRFSGSGRLATGTDIGVNMGEVPNAAHGCVTTIIVGHLAIQVLSINVPAKYDNEIVNIGCKMGPWNELLIDVWPIASGSVVWPPAQALTNDGGPLSFIRLRDRWKIGKAV